MNALFMFWLALTGSIFLGIVLLFAFVWFIVWVGSFSNILAFLLLVLFVSAMISAIIVVLDS